MWKEAIDASRAAFEQFSRGDFSAFADLPDEVRACPRAGGAAITEVRRPANGRPHSNSFEQIERGTHRVHRRLRHDQVLVRVHSTRMDSGSDVPVELRTVTVSTVRDGNFLRTLLFQNRGDALEAAGLSE